MPTIDTNLAARFKSVLKWRVIAVKTSKGAGGHETGAKQALKGGQWLDAFITSATIIRDGSDIIPFPYIKTAASIVVDVLQRIQTARSNKDGFRRLSRKLVNAITSIRDSFCDCFEGRSPPPEVNKYCLAYAKKLGDLQIGINEVVRQVNTWSSIFNATAITSIIQDYTEQVNDLRQDFMAGVLALIHDRVASHYPHHTLIPAATMIYFVDAMGDTSYVTMDFCSSPDQLKAYIKLKFSKHLGSEIINQGQFFLSILDVTGSSRMLDENLTMWSALVKPCVTITMDINLERRERSGQCPSCQNVHPNTSFEDEIRCLRCGVVFCDTFAGFIPAPASQFHNPDDYQHSIAAFSMPIMSNNARATTNSGTSKFITSLNMDNSVSMQRTYIEPLDHYRYFRRFRVFSMRWDYISQIKQQILSDRQEILGSNHSDVLEAMEDLGIFLAGIGQFEEAENLQRQVLAERQRSLGHDHCDTLNSLERLAQTLQKAGKLEEAIDLHRQVVHVFERCFSGNSDTYFAMVTLVKILREADKLQEAEDLQRRALKFLLEAEDTQQHSRIAPFEPFHATQNLASILLQNDKIQEAEDFMRQACQREYDHNSYIAYFAMGGLASLLQEVGKLQEAEDMQRRALHLLRQEVGSSDVYTLDAMQKLTMILRKADKQQEAESLKEAMKELRNVRMSRKKH